MKPSPEFLADLEALCNKHRVVIFGADYHDGVQIAEAEWPVQIFVDEDECIDIQSFLIP